MTAYPLARNQFNCKAKAAGSATYTAASLLLALTEHIKRDQQRNQRKHPSRYGDEIVILHATTLFRIAKADGAAVQVLLTTHLSYHKQSANAI